MNTQKQITLMVALVFVLLGGCAAYTVYDQPREERSLASQQGLVAERGARLFARYCRQCHGNAGEGRIGPQLNREELQDPTKLSENQTWITDTISCGRIGKIMPPWAIREGGALNDEQIRDLVTLITTNAGDGWAKAGDFSAEENKVAAVLPVEDVLKAAAITGATQRVCGQLAPATETPAADTGTLPADLKPADKWTETTTDNKFSITAIAIQGGTSTTVTVDNKGSALHNWEVLGPDGKVLKDDSGKDIAVKLTNGGESSNVTFTLSKTGVYKFQCQVHPADMVGKLYVVDANGSTGGVPPAATASPGSAAASGTPSTGAAATAPTQAAGRPENSGAPTAAGTVAGAGTNAATLTTTDNKFSQTTLTVAAGKPYQLTVSNKGAALHNFHVLNAKDDNGSDIKTDLLAAGKSAAITFTISKKGSYNFQCDVHPTEMKGTLTVQ
jgi:plastocyanin/mono/diheme cytochrome c family protein